MNIYEYLAPLFLMHTNLLGQTDAHCFKYLESIFLFVFDTKWVERNKLTTLWLELSNSIDAQVDWTRANNE